jgi:metal-dependent amidase/aminoacylase/carboxypeptidase family protein
VDDSYPVTSNDPAATATLFAALGEVLGGAAVVPGSRTMGAEDMGFVLDRVPGCYVQLGASSAPAAAAPLHSTRFTLDEECLVVGLQVMLTAAFAFG